jgi:signal peptidase I
LNAKPRPADTLKTALDILAATGEQAWLPVRGGSMLPTLREGDQVLLAPGVINLEPGDILVYRRQDELVTHRLLVGHLPGEPNFLLKGDNRLVPDPPVLSQDLLGQAIRLRRGERTMRLDTPSWRQAGRIIAVAMLLHTRLFYGDPLRRQQAASGRLRARMGRITLAALASILRLAQGIFGRWERQKPD